MARIRRRRKLMPLASNATDDDESMDDESKKAEEEEETWSQLPSDLMLLILSGLELEDNIRFAAVCKRWNEAAVSVRVVDQPPWLIYFPKHGDLHEFYDPSRRKIHTLELPELAGCKVYHSRDGWLLMSKPEDSFLASQAVFFFNPFTREVKELPRLDMAIEMMICSSAPTSSSCIVFAVSDMAKSAIFISTWYPGDTKWTLEYYPNAYPSFESVWKGAVFSGGLFYCLGPSGWLCMYDPTAKTWSVLGVHPPHCQVPRSPDSHWQPKLLAEQEGDLFVMYSYGNDNLFVFKLDTDRWVWVWKKSLDGSTFFVSFSSCETRTNLPGVTKDRVYFSKIRYFGKRCLSYKVDERRFYPSKTTNDWDEQSPFESIWIKPPENVLEFFD